jgi:hypothetical protein
MRPSLKQFSDIWDAWQFTRDAYLPDRCDYSGDEWLKARLKADSLTVIRNGNMTVVVAERKNKLIISFAGSNDMKDWLKNVRSIRTTEYHKSYVGQGFLENYKLVREQLVEICETTDKRICIYGHSAGGAAAYLHADRLNRLGIAWHEVITFESPRVFSRPVSREFMDAAGSRTCLRVTHGADFVPHVPIGIRFSHVGTEVWVPRGAQKRPVLNPSLLRRAWQTLRAIRFVSSGYDHTTEVIDTRIMLEKCMIENKEKCVE